MADYPQHCKFGKLNLKSMCAHLQREFRSRFHNKEVCMVVTSRIRTPKQADGYVLWWCRIPICKLDFLSPSTV
ncbi:hypothetical protein JTB14_022855 [Gonioctena quinquepunctata]|nr:hypothetical protein JTB14_022855 [Gonioctena quinquepunctata]